MLGSESTSVHASIRYLDRFLVHFNIGVVSMNNYSTLLVSYSLFGPCHLLQVVRPKTQLHYDDRKSLLSIICCQDVQTKLVNILTFR